MNTIRVHHSKNHVGLLFWIALLSLALISGCSDSSTGGVPVNRFEEVGRIILPGIQGTAGADTIVVATDGTLYKIYRASPAAPDILIEISSVSSGFTSTLADLVVTNDLTTGTMQNGVTTVDMSPTPANTPTVSQSPLTGTGVVSAVSVNGNTMLVGFTSSVVVYSITTPSTLVPLQTFGSSWPITMVVSAGTGFVVFSDSGYAWVNVADTNNITFAETWHTLLSKYARGSMVGTTLHASGSDDLVTTSRIGVIDLTNPAVPIALTVVRPIVGVFRDFVYRDQTTYLLMTDASLVRYSWSGSNLVQTESTPIAWDNLDFRGFYATADRYYVAINPDSLRIYQLAK